MTLVFANDNISARARAAGRTVFEQIRAEETARKRKSYCRTVQEWRGRAFAAERAAAEAEAIAKHEAWRRSWLNMCMIAVNEMIAGKDGSRRTLQRIIDNVCERYGVTRNDLVSPRRFKTLTKYRHYIYWRARIETSMSLPEIGRRVGDRDHTTILHGIRKFQAALDAREAWAVEMAEAGQ